MKIEEIKKGKNGFLPLQHFVLYLNIEDIYTIKSTEKYFNSSIVIYEREIIKRDE